MMYNDVLGSRTGPAFFRQLKQVQKLWSRQGRRIIRTLERVTGLKFQQKQYTCYVNSVHSFSDPLTLKIENHAQDVVDNLTHELIHVLLTEHYPRIKRNWDDLMEQYGAEPAVTRTHVMVHAIHEVVAIRLGLTQKHLHRIRTYSRMKSYQRAWAIVAEDSAQKIVARLKGRTH